MAVTTKENIAGNIEDIVKGRYDACAGRGGGEGAVCCPGEPPAGPSFAAEHGLYSQQELSLVPKTAFTLSRGCGNPTGFADLRAGETVVDLGCGAGIDVVLAAHKVGAGGKVVGVDFSAHMIDRARQTVAEAGLTEMTGFVVTGLGRMELADGVADVVISNCVINLCPDKEAVYREAFRILKPGGRLAVSDIALKQPLPQALSDSVAALTGCIAGALTIADYERLLRQAGFASVRIVDSESDLNLYKDCAAPDADPSAACCGTADPTSTDEGLKALRGIDVNDYAASVKVFALK